MGKGGTLTTQIGPIQYRSYHSPHNGYDVQVYTCACTEWNCTTTSVCVSVFLWIRCFEISIPASVAIFVCCCWSCCSGALLVPFWRVRMARHLHLHLHFLFCSPARQPVRVALFRGCSLGLCSWPRWCCCCLSVLALAELLVLHRDWRRCG